MTSEKCEVCEAPPPTNFFNTGLPGVFARLRHCQIISKVHRCLECKRFGSDAAAHQALEAWLELKLFGYISESSGG